MAHDGDEVALRAVQPFQLAHGAPLLLERLSRGDGHAKLLRDAFDEADVVGRPFPNVIDLGEREGTRELAADADRRCGDGDAALNRPVRIFGLGEAPILTDVIDRDGAAEPTRELRDRDAAGAATDRCDPWRVPLERNAQVILRLADGDDGAGNAEDPGELGDGAPEDVVGIEAGARPLRDPVQERLALGPRLSLFHRERAMDRPGDVLPHDHGHLHVVGCEDAWLRALEQQDADEPFARDERQRGERARLRDLRHLLRHLRPRLGVRVRVREDERVVMVDHARADERWQRGGGIGRAAEDAGVGATRGDRAKGLEDVVVDDERDRDLERHRVARRGDEVRADLLEIERTRDRCGQAEDRAELVVLLSLGAARAGERAREPMHDHGSDEADAQPDDERHELDRRKDIARVPARHDEPTPRELDRVDVLDGEENRGRIQGRCRHVEPQRARHFSHRPAPRRHRTGSPAR